MEYEQYKLKYEINNNNFINILGVEFVKHNKNKGIIIDKNKKYPLQALFHVKNKINNELKIKMLLSKDCFNKGCMFKNCTSLLLFKFNNNKNNNEDLLIKDENYYYSDFKKDNNYYNTRDKYNCKKDSFLSNICQTGIIQSENLNNINKDIIYDNFKWNTKISVINEMFANCLSLMLITDISQCDTS